MNIDFSSNVVKFNKLVKKMTISISILAILLFSLLIFNITYISGMNQRLYNDIYTDTDVLYSIQTRLVVTNNTFTEIENYLINNPYVTNPYTSEKVSAQLSNVSVNLSIMRDSLKTINNKSKSDTYHFLVEQMDLANSNYIVFTSSFFDSSLNTSEAISDYKKSFALCETYNDTLIKQYRSNYQSTLSLTQVLTSLVNFLSIAFTIICVGMIFYFRRILTKTNSEIFYKQELFELLTQSITESFIILNNTTRDIEFVSPNIDQAFSVRWDRLKNNYYSIYQYMSPESAEQIKKALQNVIYERQKPIEVLFHNPFINMDEWIELYFYSIKDKQDIFHTVISVRDNTDEKNQHDIILKALDLSEKANKTTKEFLSSTSHEIRTPISGIIGLSEIAKKKIKDSDYSYVSEALNKIQITSNHLLQLINEILDLAKIESGKVYLQNSPISLMNIIDETDVFLEYQLENKNITLNKRIDIKNPYVFGDALRIKQIIINILSNACKFTPDNGIITFEVSDKPTSKTVSSLTISITDSGPGIKEEFINQIFTPFSQENNERKDGTGLGMAITKNIVTIMNGEITVNSKERVGTNFTVVLPLKISQEEVETNKKATPQIEKIYDFSDKHILIVDDNEINLEIAKEYLSETKICIAFANNGKEALNKYLKSKVNTFDLILMDVQMPVMNGDIATKSIRASKKEDKDIPIIALTANALSDDIANSMNNGFTDYLTKPFTIDNLLEIIDKYIHK